MHTAPRTCSSISAKQTLTDDLHVVVGFFAADGVADPTGEPSVVVLLQRADQYRTFISGKNHTRAGRPKRFTIFQPVYILHSAPRRLAAEVCRAVAGDEDTSRTDDFNTRDSL